MADESVESLNDKYVSGPIENIDGDLESPEFDVGDLDIFNPPSDVSGDSAEAAPKESEKEDAAQKAEQTPKDEPEGQGKETESADLDTVPRSYATKIEQDNAKLRDQVSYLTGLIDMWNSQVPEGEPQADPFESMLENFSEKFTEDPENFGKEFKSGLSDYIGRKIQEGISQITGSETYQKVNQIVRSNEVRGVVKEILSQYDDADQYESRIVENIRAEIGDPEKLSDSEKDEYLTYLLKGGIRNHYQLAKLQDAGKQKQKEAVAETKRQTDKFANLNTGGERSTTLTQEGPKKVPTYFGELDQDDLDMVFDRTDFHKYVGR